MIKFIAERRRIIPTKLRRPIKNPAADNIGSLSGY
jgi:hypothetical protein